MRVLAILVIILGIAAIVFGILYIPQANSARQKVADSLTPPVTLDNLDATYDQISGSYDQIKASRMVLTNGIIDIILGLGLVLGGFALLRRVQSEA